MPDQDIYVIAEEQTKLHGAYGTEAEAQAALEELRAGKPGHGGAQEGGAQARGFGRTKGHILPTQFKLH